MGFSEAVKSCFNNYANFNGRASRSEFWFFRLFVVLTAIALIVLGTVLSALAGEGNEWVGAIVFGLLLIFMLGIALPSLAVAVRRLHDTNKTGFLILIAFAPFGGLVLLVFYCIGGDHGSNPFGPNPLRPNAVQDNIVRTFE